MDIKKLIEFLDNLGIRYQIEFENFEVSVDTDDEELQMHIADYMNQLQLEAEREYDSRTLH